MAGQARLLAGAFGALSAGGWMKQRVYAEKPSFRKATCTGNQVHTHNTRKLSFVLNDKLPWTENGAVANIVVKANLDGAAESGCCACCKCPSPCGCPKSANGCCACCKCPEPCGCPKTVAAKAESGSSSAVARPYNPLSARSGSEFTILVKKYEAAKMGTKLHSLQTGDAIEIRGPNQQWHGFEVGKYKHYGFIAGGTGITPLIQNAEFVLSNDADASVTLLTFNKTAEDILLRSELQALKQQFPGRLHVQHFVEDAPMHMFAYGAVQRAEKHRMRAVLADALPRPSDEAVLLMVCGRKEMTEFLAGPKTPDFKQGELGGVLKALGYEKAQVWKL